MELKVEELQQLQPIKFNYTELKKELVEQTKVYKTAVYTDDNIAKAKEDRAKLNKFAKSLNDEKIRVKNEVLENYTNDFEPKILELKEIVEEASANIDNQVKAYEEKKKKAKRTEIVEYFNNKVGIYEGLIDLDKIFNDRWLNVTYDIEETKKEIDHIFSKAKSDLLVIDSFKLEDNLYKQLQSFYFSHIDSSSCLSETIQEKNRIEQMNENLTRVNQVNRQTTIQNNNTVSKTAVAVEKKNELEELGLRYIQFKVLVSAEECKTIGKVLKENNITYGTLEADLLTMYKEMHQEENK